MFSCKIQSLSNRISPTIKYIVFYRTIYVFLFDHETFPDLFRKMLTGFYHKFYHNSIVLIQQTIIERAEGTTYLYK